MVTYNRRKRERRCVTCNVPLNPNEGVRCDTHAREHVLRAMADQQKHYDGHLARQRSINRRAIERARAQKTCITCGDPHDRNALRCETCQGDDTEAQRRRAA